MGASRQCQQHIPLNQKQPPYYSSYAKEGRAGCGTLTVRPVQIGGNEIVDQLQHGRARWEKGESRRRWFNGRDSLRGQVTRKFHADCPASVNYPWFRMDGRQSTRFTEQLGQVWPNRRAARQHLSCISFALMRGISRWQLLNQPDELMKHQIILPGINSRRCFGIFEGYLLCTWLWVSANR